MSDLTPAASALLSRIRALVRSSRNTVARAVNTMQMLTNFEIGRQIVEYEQDGAHRAEYGKALLKELSASSSKDLGRGFSQRNLEYMRKFYLLYRDRAPQISQTLSAKLPAELEPGPGQNVGPSSGGSSLPARAGLASPGSSSPFVLSWSHYVFLMSMETPRNVRSTRARQSSRDGPCASSAVSSIPACTNASP